MRLSESLASVCDVMDMSALIALDAVQTQLSAAKAQLQRYRQTLLKKDGDALRLHTYAVVAFGFERLANLVRK